jgi:sodium-dependent dicarboxylate transporter 2/3/5
VLRLQQHRSNYAKALFLSMAWGTTIGGVATLLGGARAPLALGMAREAGGQGYTFLQWALANLPIVAIPARRWLGWSSSTFFRLDVQNIARPTSSSPRSASRSAA